MDSGTDNYRRFLNGEDEAIGELVKEYRKGLYHFLLGIVRDPDLADDLTEDTFVKLLVKRPPHTEKTSFRTWLYTIGRNLAMDHFRRQERRGEIGTEEFSFLEWALPSPEELYRQQVDAATLSQCLDRLEPVMRQALYLRFYEDFSIGEIAKILHKNRHAVSSLLYRAKKSLKEELLKEGFTYEI